MDLGVNSSGICNDWLIVTLGRATSSDTDCAEVIVWKMSRCMDTSYKHFRSLINYSLLFLFGKFIQL